jgi:hypothetical protein
VTDKVKIYWCKLCEQSWDKLPDETVELTPARRGGNGHVTTVRLPDGSVHAVKRVIAPTREGVINV